ncbi:MAG: hypothetical protein D6739_06980 [Nitrospirae bacterium]|nr:MAG: hypothetical protein D6739_06980 [Nitrospirota bacterium]
MPVPLPLWNARDRRGAVAACAGDPILLWRNPVMHLEREDTGRAHVYLDVSDSLAHHLQLLYGALLSVRSFIHPMVHLFSTVVADLPLEGLRRGRVETTGGTRLGCVLDHIRRQGIRRALILTDGWVEPLGEADLRGLEGTRIAALVTQRGPTDFARRIGARVFVLPNLWGYT